MRKKLFQICFAALTLCAFVLTSNFLGTLLMPMRTDYGSTWDSFLQEPEDSIDVMFFGSSMVYCNVIPGVIYDNTDVTSYVMAGPEMTIPITYYYVRESCNTQSPKLIVVELNGLFFSRYTSFTKVTVGYMPWSVNRIAATLNGAEPAERFGLFFPLYNYHSRLSTATKADIASHLSPSVDPYAGYTPLSEAKPQDEVYFRGYDATTENFARNMEYLEKISAFCQDNQIKLLFYTSPAMAQIPPEAMETLERELADLPWGDFVDFNASVDQMSIDHQKDWFDSLHFNVYGAQKFSTYLSSYLMEHYSLPATSHIDTQLWNSRTDKIYEYLEGS